MAAERNTIPQELKEGNIVKTEFGKGKIIAIKGDIASVLTGNGNVVSKEVKSLKHIKGNDRNEKRGLIKGEMNLTPEAQQTKQSINKLIELGNKMVALRKPIFENATHSPRGGVWVKDKNGNESFLGAEMQKVSMMNKTKAPRVKIIDKDGNIIEFSHGGGTISIMISQQVGRGQTTAPQGVVIDRATMKVEKSGLDNNQSVNAFLENTILPAFENMYDAAQRTEREVKAWRQAHNQGKEADELKMKLAA